MKDIQERFDKVIDETTNEHPYKERGNRGSYNSYNEGWSDACDILGERLKQEAELALEKQRAEIEEKVEYLYINSHVGHAQEREDRIFEVLQSLKEQS